MDMKMFLWTWHVLAAGGHFRYANRPLSDGWIPNSVLLENTIRLNKSQDHKSEPPDIMAIVQAIGMIAR